jgi:ABC-type multidrug transport system fused ATPase/permease subunit
MEEQNIISEEPQELSQMDAISGIFTEPGNTFNTIMKFPKRNFWLLPVIILVLTSIVSSFLFFSDAELVSKMMDKQKMKMREKMQESVKEGKMSQQQANEAIERAEKFMDPNGLFFKITGFAGAVVAPFIMLFVLSVIYMLLLKMFKANFEFTNILNVVGLSLIVSAIGSIIGIVLSIVMGDLTSVGLALAFKADAVGETFHGLFMKLDVFTIWFYVLVAIGLVRVAKIKPVISYSIVFGLWVIWLVITTFVFTMFT